ncbi:MAG: GrpB family protein [Bacteroidales bacterium]|nr:GrpB family protein [Bacteroidales bacterium]
MTNEELWQLFPIILSKYNPLWPEQFKKEKTAIEKAIGKKNITRINHIGSTAIPGLIAKPTIDILLEIKTGTNLDKLIDSIDKTGYIHTPQPQKPAPHIMFMKGYTPQGFKKQVFHLHLRYPGDWDELYFRDYLISHPETAEEYGKLKCKLAPVFRNNRDGYTEAKGKFIKKINKLAKEKFSGKYTPQK